MNKLHIKQHLDLLNLTTKKILIVDNADLLTDNISTDSYDSMIFDCATPYLGNVTELDIYVSLNKLNLPIDWAIITSNFTYYKSNIPKILYYPIYFIDGIDKGSYTTIDIWSQRLHNLSFLTYHLHWHRLLSLLALYKQKWFNTCLINLLPINQLNASQLQGYQNGIISLNLTELAELTELFKLTPLVADETDDQREIVNIQNRSFSDCYVNMFTESDYPREFITEKSIKPFLSGQFFAIIANNEIYTHLQELGFDLLLDYIDVRTVENTQGNLRNHIDITIKQISNLLPNIKQAWDDTYIRRKHNYELARSPALRNELCRELLEHLNKHKETI
jgi:hypothetical protein